MSWNHCTITGEPLEEPVISKLTGHIYEKRVITKHIESLGTCPITGQPMTVQDIIEIQVNKTARPRNIAATSVPQLLTIFQSEWDTLMTETLNLKQQLQVVRQELSHALYQHDAACRVIARLIRERDIARAELVKVQEKGHYQQEIEIEQKKQSLLGEELIKQINEKALELNTMRKERRKTGFEGYTSQEEIINFKQKSSITLHSVALPGITCLSLNKENERFIATGGMDTTSLLYDLQESKLLYTFEQHTKKINDVIFVPSSDKHKVLTCSDDNKGYLYSVDPESLEGEIKYLINQHNGALTEMSLHPLNTLVAVASKDASWSYHDIAIGKFINKVDQWDANLQFNSINFHPDGHILAAGCSDGSVKLWNLSEDSIVATLDSSNKPCDMIAFSENGYHFTTCSSATGIVKIWDLRHLTNVMTFFEGEANATSAVCFDTTGQFLAIGRENGLNLYSSKTWEKLLRFDGNKEPITNIEFGQFSKSIVACSMDRHLTVYN